MYIKRVEINEIKGIKRLVWELPDNKLSEGGWHVVIGDNSSGKTTFLQSIALALLGGELSQGLRKDWSTWLPKSQGRQSNVFVQIEPNEKYDIIDETEFSKELSKTNLKNNSIEHTFAFAFKLSKFPPSDSNGIVRVGAITKSDIHRNNQTKGWFVCSFGPFRRFKGGNSQYDDIFKVNPKLASHISLFDEGIALKESINWLQELHYKELERRVNESPKRDFFNLEHLVNFINISGLLPHDVFLKSVTTEGLIFNDLNDNQVNMQNLSDGFKSILSLILELFRQLFYTYGDTALNIIDGKVYTPGVVLIDEVDAHLHPSWQKNIGLWFRKYFPNIQFIVTTHSPIICQAVAVGGSVFKLPKPNSDETGYMVEGTELNRLVYGNVLDAYGTDLFGEDVTQSEHADKMLYELALLNQKELHKGLSKTETERQRELRKTFPTSIPSIPST